MKKILITGSRGFVGRHYVKRFLAEGHQMTLIDIEGGGIDARDFFRTDDTHYDQVVHLAAVVGGRRLIEGSPLSLAVDLSIDAEMFSWAVRTKPGCVIYFSSSAAYPISGQTRDSLLRQHESWINLDRIENPDMSYGWAKLTGEMLATYARNAGIEVHIYRPFSGYGTDQSLDYPFPSFIDRAKRKADPFEIWGDGNQVRDFIHINDIIEGSLAGCVAGVKVSNLCTGRPTSFNQLAELVCSIRGYKPKIAHLEAEPVGVAYRVGDPGYQNTFYRPEISLEEGIERAFVGW